MTTSDMSTGFLEKVDYNYDSSGNLNSVSYSKDYDRKDADSGELDYIVNYSYEGNGVDLFLGYICGGEKILYNYTSPLNPRISSIKYYFNEEQLSELNYVYEINETCISNHLNDFVTFSFDRFGHTISILDNDGNVVFYSYRNIYQVPNDDIDYRKNHQIIYQSSPSLSRNNYIQNGSFEGSINRWTLGTNSYAANTTINKLIGSRALCLANGGYIYQDVVLDKGVYTLSSGVFNDTGSDDVFLEVNSFESERVSSTDSWRFLTVPIYIEEDNTTIQVKLRNNTTDDVYFDNVVLIKGLNNQKVNLIENSSFELNLEHWIIGEGNPSRVYVGSSTYDDVGDFAVAIEGNLETYSTFSTRVDKDMIDAYDKDGWLYVGGWVNAYTSPRIDKNQLFISIAFFDKNNERIEAEEPEVFNRMVFFDQSKDSWQFNYNRIILPEVYSYMIVSFNYLGLGEVLFGGANVFFDASEMYYITTYEDIPDGDLDEENNKKRIDKIEWNDGRLIDYIYSEEYFADEPIGFRDEDGNTYEIGKINDIIDYIVFNKVKYNTTYNDYGQAIGLEVSGIDGSGGFVDYFDVSTTYTSDSQYVDYRTDAFGNITNYQTDVITGLLTYIENAKNVKTDYEYYDNGLLKKVSIEKNSFYDSYVIYVYNANNQLIEIKINHNSTTGYSYYIDYDDAGRMVSVSINNQKIMSYAYIGDLDLIDESIYNGYDISDSLGYVNTIADSMIIMNEDSILLQTTSGNRNPTFGSSIEVESQQTYIVSMDILNLYGSVKYKIYEYSGTPGISTFLGMQESSSISSSGKYSFEFTTKSNTKYIYVTLSDSSTYTIEFSNLILEKQTIRSQDISRQTYGNGDKIYFTYTEENLIEKISYQEFGEPVIDKFSYLYDESGKLAVYNDLVNEYTEYYEYDGSGNLVKITNSDEDVIKYEYDGSGNLSKIRYDISGTDSYSNYYYQSELSNNLYYLTSFNNGGDNIQKQYVYEQNAINRLDSILYTNNSSNLMLLEIEYEDNTRRLNEFTYSIAGTDSTQINYTYQYDSIGNITNEVYIKDSIDNSEDAHISKSYVYDDMNQLIQEHSRDYQYTASSISANTNYTKYYHYDINGNMIAINTFGYGLSEEVEPEIPSFSLLNRGRYSAEMVYNGTYNYQDIYDLQVGQSPTINFTFYDHWDTNHQWPLNLTVTELIDNLDTSNEGYYYNYYKATDGLNYDVRFRIVFKVGTPPPELREGGNYISYSYNNAWLDQLDDYTIDNDTSNITYDESGNPINITNFKYEGTLYNHAELEWEGRKLVNIKVYNSSDNALVSSEIWYTYNDQGLRIKKVIEDSSGIIKYDYKLSGDLVILEIVSEYNDSTQIYDEVYKMLYSYDYDGTPIGFTYIDDLETTDYIYVKNLMGDMTHITDLNGNIVVEYSYDAYGNITQVQGEKASTIGKFNSLRYRSYMYDEETAFYYLQSRYYNPEIGRFINADGLLGQVGNIQTHNMYAYCANNPVMFTDSTGYFWDTVLDVGFLIWSIVDVWNDPSDWKNWAALGADLLFMAIPFATGGSKIIKAGNNIDDAVDVTNMLNRLDDLGDLSKVTLIGRDVKRVTNSANLFGVSDNIYDAWKGYKKGAKGLGKFYNGTRSVIHNGNWMLSTLRNGYTVVDIGMTTLHSGRGLYYGTERLIIGLWRTRHVWKVPLNYYF